MDSIIGEEFRSSGKEYDDWMQEYDDTLTSELKKVCDRYKDVDDYVRFLRDCIALRNKLCVDTDGSNPIHSNDPLECLRLRVGQVLRLLSQRNRQLYTKVLSKYLEMQDPLNLNYEAYNLVLELVQHQGYSKARKILLAYDYPSKNRWLSYMYQVIPEKEINQGVMDDLYALHEEAKLVELPYGFDYLQKFCGHDSKVIVNITKILAGKSGIGSHMSSLFYCGTEVGKRLFEIFMDDLDLLKQVYLSHCTDERPDSDGSVFSQFMERDPHFIIEYLDARKNIILRGRNYTSGTDYESLWHREDYMDVMERAIHHIYTLERSHWQFFSYAENFFIMFEYGENNSGELSRREKTSQRQKKFVLKIIEQHHNDLGWMSFIFRLVCVFPTNFRIICIQEFLKYNKNLEDFRNHIHLEHIRSSAMGSWVPVYQSKLDYYKEIRSLMVDVALLEHREYIEYCIKGIEQRIEREKARDFINMPVL